MSNYVTHIRREQRKIPVRSNAKSKKPPKLPAPTRTVLQKKHECLTPEEWRVLQEMVLTYVVLRLWHQFANPK
jgi:hypothetical protein